MYHRSPFVPSVQPLFHGPGFIEILCASPMRSELPTPLLSTTLPRRILYHAERPPEEHSRRADSSISLLQPDFSFIPATTPFHLPARVYYVWEKFRISETRTVSQKHTILIIFPGENKSRESHHSIPRRIVVIPDFSKFSKFYSILIVEYSPVFQIFPFSFSFSEKRSVRLFDSLFHET